MKPNEFAKAMRQEFNALVAQGWEQGLTLGAVPKVDVYCVIETIGLGAAKKLGLFDQIGTGQSKDRHQ